MQLKLLRKERKNNWRNPALNSILIKICTVFIYKFLRFPIVKKKIISACSLVRKNFFPFCGPIGVLESSARYEMDPKL